MIGVILVRLKNKTTDKYVDSYPYLESPRRVHNIITHSFQLDEAGSLTIFKHVHSATYNSSTDNWYQWEQTGSSVAAHYVSGQFASVREDELDPFAPSDDQD